METLILAAVVMMVLFVTAVLLGVFLVRWQLRRRNRVVPNAASPAPLTWLGSPARAARLHRRLQAAVVLANLAAGTNQTIDGLRGALAARTTEVDRALVAAARSTGNRRRQVLDALETEVRRIEDLAMRIESLGRQSRAPIGPGSAQSELEELAERLENLEQAHAELRKVEEGRGITHPGPATST